MWCRFALPLRARDLDTGFGFLRPDVDWQNGWEGGRLRGHPALRDYWTRQWAVIESHVEPVGVAADPHGRIVVVVRQTLRDLGGNVLDARLVRHVYTMDRGLISRMDIVERDEPDPPAPA